MRMRRVIQRFIVLLGLLILLPTLASAVEPEASTDAEPSAIGEALTGIKESGTFLWGDVEAEPDEGTEPPAETPPEEAEPSPEVPKEITVTYQEGETILLSLTLLAGEAPNQAPETGESGEEILGWVVNGTKVSDPTAVILNEDTVYTVWKQPVFNTEEHIPYVNGKGNGSFAPDQNITRAETAVMISSLLKNPTDGTLDHTFSDVSSGDWFHWAVTTLASFGVVDGYQDGTFQPQRPISRAEFVTILSAFYPAEMTEGGSRFSDVSATHWARNNILTAAARGWINGYEDGSFRPDESITRAQAVTVLNSVLGRSAAANETRSMIRENGICIFTDVRPEHWYYSAVMEASIAHGFSTESGQESWTAFTYKSCGYDPGWQRIGNAYYIVDANRQITFQTPGIQTIHDKLYYVADDGSIPAYDTGAREIGASLYWVNEDGSLLTNGSAGYLFFGPDGRYTSGNAEIDALVMQTLGACINSGMTREEKLHASYLYLRENTRYLSRAHQERGTTHWYEDYAIFMFKNHRGNCYCYAAAFMYMARQLGYQAYSISGGLGASNDDHAWVMIDGRIFDPELEYAYLHRYSYSRYYNLYNIVPASAPFLYRFP